MIQPVYTPQPAATFNSKLLVWSAIGVAGISLITSTYLWYRQKSLERIIEQNNTNFLNYKQQWQHTLMQVNTQEAQLVEQHSNTLDMLAKALEKIPSTSTIMEIQQRLDKHEDTLRKYRKITHSLIDEFFDYRNESRIQIADLYNVIQSNSQPQTSDDPSYETKTVSDGEHSGTQSEDEETPQKVHYTLKSLKKAYLDN
jgi:hypothetical protein